MLEYSIEVLQTNGFGMDIINQIIIQFALRQLTQCFTTVSSKRIPLGGTAVLPEVNWLSVQSSSPSGETGTFTHWCNDRDISSTDKQNGRHFVGENSQCIYLKSNFVCSFDSNFT